MLRAQASRSPIFRLSLRNCFAFSPPNGPPVWLERVRTAEDLNLRLSVCVQHKQPYHAHQLLEYARVERLPFDDLSIQYVVLAMAQNGHCGKAELLLDNIVQQEAFQPSEKCFIPILSVLAGSFNFKGVNKLLTKMESYNVHPTGDAFQSMAVEIKRRFDILSLTDRDVTAYPQLFVENLAEHASVDQEYPTKIAIDLLIALSRAAGSEKMDITPEPIVEEKPVTLLDMFDESPSDASKALWSEAGLSLLTEEEKARQAEYNKYLPGALDSRQPLQFIKDQNHPFHTRVKQLERGLTKFMLMDRSDLYSKESEAVLVNEKALEITDALKTFIHTAINQIPEGFKEQLEIIEDAWTEKLQEHDGAFSWINRNFNEIARKSLNDLLAHGRLYDVVEKTPKQVVAELLAVNRQREARTTTAFLPSASYASAYTEFLVQEFSKMVSSLNKGDNFDSDLIAYVNTFIQANTRKHYGAAKSEIVDERKFNELRAAAKEHYLLELQKQTSANELPNELPATNSEYAQQLQDRFYVPNDGSESETDRIMRTNPEKYLPPVPFLSESAYESVDEFTSELNQVSSDSEELDPSPPLKQRIAFKDIQAALEEENATADSEVPTQQPAEEEVPQDKESIKAQDKLKAARFIHDQVNPYIATDSEGDVESISFNITAKEQPELFSDAKTSAPSFLTGLGAKFLGNDSDSMASAAESDSEALIYDTTHDSDKWLRTSDIVSESDEDVKAITAKVLQNPNDEIFSVFSQSSAPAVTNNSEVSLYETDLEAQIEEISTRAVMPVIRDLREHPAAAQFYNNPEGIVEYNLTFSDPHYQHSIRAEKPYATQFTDQYHHDSENGPEIEAILESAEDDDASTLEDDALDLEENLFQPGTNSDGEEEFKCEFTGIRMDKHRRSLEPLELIDPHAFSFKHTTAGIPDPLKEVPISESPEERNFSAEEIVILADGDIELVNLQYEYPLRLSLNNPKDTTLYNSAFGMLYDNGVRLSEPMVAGLIEGYGVGGDISIVNLIIEEMNRCKMQPTAPIFNAILDAYSRSNREQDVEKILELMNERRFKLEYRSTMSLANMYITRQYFQKATDLLNTLRKFPKYQPDIKSYSLFIRNAACQGQLATVEDLLSELESFGLTVTAPLYELIFDSFLTSTSPVGVLHFYSKMVKSGIVPSENALNSYIAALSKLGFEKAIYNTLQLILEMNRPLTSYHFEQTALMLTQSPEKLSQLAQLVHTARSIIPTISAKFFQIVSEGFIKHATDLSEIAKLVRGLENGYRGLVKAAGQQIHGTGTLIADYLSQRNCAVNATASEMIIEYYAENNQPEDLIYTYNSILRANRDPTLPSIAHAITCLFKNRLYHQCTQVVALARKDGDLSTLISVIEILKRTVVDKNGIGDFIVQFVHDEAYLKNTVTFRYIDLPERENRSEILLQQEKNIFEAYNRQLKIQKIRSHIPKQVRALMRYKEQKMQPPLSKEEAAIEHVINFDEQELGKPHYQTIRETVGSYVPR